MGELRFAVFGAGFWAPYQLAAWGELKGARCVALYNRTRERAEALARRAGIPAVYDDAEELIRRERPDFLDVVTSVETHAPFVRLAAEHGLPVICQKPMATTLAEAEEMVAVCQRAGVPLFVHENWRWQEPLRRLKQALDEGRIGRPFRARIEYNSSFPVFDNQPFLKELEQFILTDMGSHILDVGRFLLGEVERLYCQTHRVHPDIAGEDVATVMMRTRAGATLTCEISYASRTEKERFPQTFVLVEGEEGSLELAPDYWVRLTTAEGVFSRRWPPPVYPWSDPAYALVHSSIVSCNADILRALRGEGRAETTGEDNLQTVRLVFAAYESAATGRAVVLPG
ncbi:MAG: Gfo/Idh/MocA family oxidoreductase [Anaerolineae bacterium]|nr:Gfo/Idh/MocA family oxidoreductase [Anaerolineae bacterium]